MRERWICVLVCVAMVGCAPAPSFEPTYVDSPLEGCDEPRIFGTALLLVDELTELQPYGGSYEGLVDVRNGGEVPMGLMTPTWFGDGVATLQANSQQTTGNAQVPVVVQPGDSVVLRLLLNGPDVAFASVRLQTAALTSHGAEADPYVQSASVGFIRPDAQLPNMSPAVVASLLAPRAAAFGAGVCVRNVLVDEGGSHLTHSLTINGYGRMIVTEGTDLHRTDGITVGGYSEWLELPSEAPPQYPDGNVYRVYYVSTDRHENQAWDFGQVWRYPQESIDRLFENARREWWRDEE